MKSPIAILLAGGKSSRIGQDKANLVLDSQKLLHKQFVTMANVIGKENIYVSGDRPEFNGIIDIEKNFGPLEGIRSVCCALVSLQIKDKPVLVMPVDMPFLDEEFLEFFISEGVNHFKLSSIDGIHFENFELPVFFKSYVNLMHQIRLMKILNSKLSFKELFKKIRLNSLRIGFNEKKFININTMEDYNVAISQANAASSNR